jgi:hypothetical protein
MTDKADTFLKAIDDIHDMLDELHEFEENFKRKAYVMINKLENKLIEMEA